jgi:voltage-dependent anion channel protein 2
VENALKVAWKAKKYGLAAAIGAGGKVTATGTVAEVAPGLQLSLSGTLPDAATARLGLDYVHRALVAKASIGLAASPKIEASATTAVGDVALGGGLSLEGGGKALAAWSVGAALTRPDYQASALLADLGRTLKLGYAHNIDARTVAGAEVTKALGGSAEPACFALGYGKVLDNGALAKVRLESSGLASLLYEQDLTPLAKLALSSQFDATSLDANPKVGVALALKN